MSLELQKVKEVKSRIKHLYKEYDQHLDRVTKLGGLLDDENKAAQKCFHLIQECNSFLKELEDGAIFIT